MQVYKMCQPQNNPLSLVIPVRGYQGVYLLKVKVNFTLAMGLEGQEGE
jgi:hypothetical protein